MASPAPAVADSASEPVTIGTTGTMVLLSADSLELLEDSKVGREVVCSAAVAGSVDEGDVVVTPVPEALSDATVEIGTGTAVVPSVPVDVLRL